jgi:LysR family hydrogen peroxide-inducible transcriptional activator
MAGLNWAHVSDDELFAAMPAGHPLAREKSASIAALEREELILLEDGHCLREHALAACGLNPRSRYQAKRASPRRHCRPWSRWCRLASA